MANKHHGSHRKGDRVLASTVSSSEGTISANASLTWTTTKRVTTAVIAMTLGSLGTVGYEMLNHRVSAPRDSTLPTATETPTAVPQPSTPSPSPILSTTPSSPTPPVDSTPPPTTVTPSLTAAFTVPGPVLVLNGSGFAANQQFQVILDDRFLIGTTTSDAHGNLQANIDQLRLADDSVHSVAIRRAGAGDLQSVDIQAPDAPEPTAAGVHVSATVDLPPIEIHVPDLVDPLLNGLLP